MEAAFKSGFASALLDVLFNKVSDVMIVELKKVLRSDEALEKLETTILQAQNLLNQVDTSKMQGTTKTVVQKRLNKLTTLYYDADDLMGDIVLLMGSQSESYERSVLNGILASPRSWSKPREITRLQEKLDAILDELKVLVEQLVQPESNTRQPNYRQKPNSEMHFIGRDDDVEAITRNLVSCNSECQGVSIVGMDGLGKTMLALTIQNKARVTAYFSVKLWVDIYDGCFNLEETIKQLDQLQAKELPNQGDSTVLITFDNLLEVKLADWNTFWSYITSKRINGKRYTNIRFLITTFSSKVVTNTRTSSHYLEPLCDEDCKKVIVATAQSLNNSLSKHYALNDVSLDLAKNYSGGLPSVASLLGAFLGQYGVLKVRKILRDGLWDSTEFDAQIFRDLMPCYSKMQLHLKQCLGYFSLFPHNYAFTIDELVHLWVGEGFIQDPRAASNLIEIGKEHFNELLGMSILRHSDQMTHNGMPTYVLNHFSHKLAQLAASTTCVRLAQGVSASYRSTRHLSLFYSNNSFPIWDDLKKFKALRTFYALFKSNIGKIPCSAFKKLTRIRVLSLSGSDVCEIPHTINGLKRLSYLNISRTPIKSLPETLCELNALQFLKLAKDVGGFDCLPRDFQKLTNLIYLDWDMSDINRMGGLPSHIGKLSSLQTLPLFPVGENVGHLISELKNMKHLQGSIRITNLENVKDWAMSTVAALHEKAFREIELEWKRPKSSAIAKQVLTRLKPCQYLIKLKITNYHGDAFPDWMTDSLPELEELRLQKCPNVQGLPENGLLPSLKVLVLEKIGNVVNVDHPFFGEGHFPKLESLEIKHMEQLQTWMVRSESNVMPSLRTLKFIDCPSLINVSSLKHLSSLEKMEIQCCEALSLLPDLPVSLDYLVIEESDLLNERCKEGEDDWPKVDCIKNVEIGYQKIPTSGLKCAHTS